MVDRSSLNASLINVLYLFYSPVMEQDRIVAALSGAPAWAKVGLTMPSEKMRERAALEIANCIIDVMERPTIVADRDQLALPL